jgi:tetratricopeptide (TPR) repeat protein
MNTLFYGFTPHASPTIEPRSRKLALLFSASILCLFITQCALSGRAQTENLGDLKQKAAELIKKNKYTEALPLLEQIVAAEPNDARMQFYIGFALLGQANNTNGDSGQRALRVRARAAFIKAKQLGINEPLVDGMIQGIPEDGASAGSVSSNIEANRLMAEAEGFFAQGKLDDALRDYQKALQLDPNLYEAALFSGDVYMQKEDFTQAEVWYQRAIKIDPNRETAYRYSATPLMKQHKYDEARDRYVDAYISEPYNRFSIGGLGQWSQITQTTIGHPVIDIPTNVTFDEKGNAQINLDSNALTQDDGSFAWISYGATRTTWHKEKFARTFPGEQTYRHSLPEEIEALQSVITLAASDKRTKSLSPSLARLKKLNDQGLLEAFILLARADQGLSRDFPAYLKANRAKLRRYVLEYVIAGGDN